MNREIKFRGKRIDTGEWVYGSYFESYNVIATFIKDSDNIYIDKWIEVAPETVGQYIGLDDFYNKEIYEGDFIVDNGWDDEPLEVIYNDEDFAFKVKEHINGREYFWDSRYKNIIDAKCYTIIGNIYDNPELIAK